MATLILPESKMNPSSMSRLLTIRNLLLGILFVVLIMAIYFALLPAGQYFKDTQEKTYNPYLYFPEGQDKIYNYFNSSWMEAAKKISDKHGYVLTTMSNDAYFDFVASWSCNAAKLGGNILKKVYIFIF